MVDVVGLIPQWVVLDDLREMSKSLSSIPECHLLHFQTPGPCLVSLSSLSSVMD